MSLTDDLEKEKAEREQARIARGGNPPQKIPTGKGDGKWETKRTIVKYRKSRDAAKKLAKANRKRNRR